MVAVIRWPQTQDRLPDRVYLDTSVLFAAYTRNDRYHKSASSFLWSCQLLQETVLAVSPLVLAECYCQLIRAEDRRRHGQARSAQDIKLDAAFLRSCNPCYDGLHNFVSKRVKSGRFVMVSNPFENHPTALDVMKETPMLPYDSLHYATLKQAGIGAIATTDSDFERIADDSLTVLSLA